MARVVEMDPRYFAKMWCHYRGDLFAFYYGMHKNYTTASIITLYKRVKKAVPKLPTMVLKNEDYETLPEEHKFLLNSIICNKSIKQRTFIQKFDAHRQKTENLRNRKFGSPVSSGRKLVPYEEATNKISQ